MTETGGDGEVFVTEEKKFGGEPTYETALVYEKACWDAVFGSNLLAGRRFVSRVEYLSQLVGGWDGYTLRAWKRVRFIKTHLGQPGTYSSETQDFSVDKRFPDGTRKIWTTGLQIGWSLTYMRKFPSSYFNVIVNEDIISLRPDVTGPDILIVPTRVESAGDARVLFTLRSVSEISEPQRYPYSPTNGFMFSAIRKRRQIVIIEIGQTEMFGQPVWVYAEREGLPPGERKKQRDEVKEKKRLPGFGGLSEGIGG